VASIASWKKLFFKNIIAFILLISSTGIYYYSLQTCPFSYDDPNDCIAFFRKMYPVMMFCCIIVGAIWLTVTTLSMKKIFSRYWILALIFQFCGLFFYSSGMEMDNHGGINRFAFTMTILVLSIVYSTSIGLKKLWKYSKKLFICLFT